MHPLTNAPEKSERESSQTSRSEHAEVRPPAESSSKRRLSRFSNLLAFLILSAVNFACFAPILKKVGFYLDDWITLNLLSFGPKSFGQAFYHYLLSDPRVIVRPVEALYYVVLYSLFGLKPFGYHLVNASLEVLSAFLFYLALNKLCARPALSLVAAVILVIYPSHDVTHYWATCSSENLSLFFTMASLYCTVCAVSARKNWWHAASAACFALSVFCYETFLPLAVLNFSFACILAKAQPKPVLFKQLGFVVAPFTAVVGALLLYSRVIAPKLGTAQVHAVHFKFEYFARAISEGIRINCPPVSTGFFTDLAAKALQYEPLVPLCITLAVLSLAVIASIWALSSSSPGSGSAKDSSASAAGSSAAGSAAAGSSVTGASASAPALTRATDQPIFLLPLGMIAVVASYSIFGLNPEYVPTFETILNRVNEGSVVGIGMIVAGLAACLLKFGGSAMANRKAETVVLTLLVIPVLLLSFLANKGFARPWELCWYTQTVIRDSIIRQSAHFKSGDAIILANCPRYVMWSPLFDGVWDFQPMVQLALKNKNIAGGVVSERMKIEGNKLKDVSMGVTCNVYDLTKSYVIFPPSGDIVQVGSPTAFVDLIQKRGMLFHLDQEALNRWRQEIAAGPARD